MQTNLIVQCKKCKHQYQVHEKRVGESFHCFCGNTLTVPKLEVHDAAVVRCSSCGGARGEKAEPFCNYCGSSFTLLEQDLNTICPSCFTRISSKASFCHSCATPIVAESEFFDTDLQCPSCEHSKLHSRTIAENTFNIKECNSCAGIWISNEVFEHLEKDAKLKAITGLNDNPENNNSYPTNENINPRKFYKKCPHCQTMMNRKNYAQSSGVIVDVCSLHGIWFDIHELDQILSFIANGQLQKHQDKKLRKAKAAEHKAKISMQNAQLQRSTSVFNSNSGNTLESLIKFILR